MALGMTALGDTEYSNYACAEVVQSRDATFKEGDVIACQAGWQDYQIISSADAAIGYPRPN
jgi:NADPH-dependent curcumin reductase CurA